MFTKTQLIITIVKNIFKSILAIGFAILVINFSTEKITTISTSLEQKRILTFSLERTTQTMYDLGKDFEEIGVREQMLYDALPSIENILSFVSALEKLGEMEGISQRTTFGNAAPQGEFYQIPISITLNGDIDSFISYLEAFESLPFFSAITSLDIKAQSSGSWKNRSTITLQVIFYAK